MLDGASILKRKRCSFARERTWPHILRKLARPRNPAAGARPARRASGAGQRNDRPRRAHRVNCQSMLSGLARRACRHSRRRGTGAGAAHESMLRRGSRPARGTASGGRSPKSSSKSLAVAERTPTARRFWERTMMLPNNVRCRSTSSSSALAETSSSAKRRRSRTPCCSPLAEPPSTRRKAMRLSQKVRRLPQWADDARRGPPPRVDGLRHLTRNARTDPPARGPRCSRNRESEHHSGGSALGRVVACRVTADSSRHSWRTIVAATRHYPDGRDATGAHALASGKLRAAAEHLSVVADDALEIARRLCAACLSADEDVTEIPPHCDVADESLLAPIVNSDGADRRRQLRQAASKAQTSWPRSGVATVSGRH